MTLVRDFRDQLPDAVTLPQLFKTQGWYTARVGKIFHYNVPAGIGTDGLDDPLSWEQVVNPRGRDTYEEGQIFNAEPHRPVSAALSWLAAEGTDEEQTDGMIATEAIRIMREHRSEPFFLAAGFFRPHTPYVAPRKYFDLYPLDKITLPHAPQDDRDDIPSAAFAHNCKVPNYGLSELTCRKALQAYFACVSFVDAQVGRLMNALDEFELADNTIVVLWSDHGYHLGEHGGVWQKRCLFEESARAPLIFYVPHGRGNRSVCRRIVEFVDIYPTLAELAGLKPPVNLAGRSLRPLLDDPNLKWHGSAFTQILRPGDDQPHVGRSIRTQQWRFSQWGGPNGGRELYDHTNDPDEFTNLASQPRYREVVKKLQAALDAKIQIAVPTSPFRPGKL